MEKKIFNEFFLDSIESKLFIFAGVLTIVMIYVFYKIIKVALKENKEIREKSN